MRVRQEGEVIRVNQVEPFHLFPWLTLLGGVICSFIYLGFISPLGKGELLFASHTFYLFFLSGT